MSLEFRSTEIHFVAKRHDCFFFFFYLFIYLFNRRNVTRFVFFLFHIALDWCTDFLLSTLLIVRYSFFLFAQVVLSACSSYFQKLLLSNPCKHPTIIMPQDVCFNDLKFIIEFVYRGEIDVSQAELQVRVDALYTYVLLENDEPCHH